MKNKKKYNGTIVPLITPVTADFKLDHEAVERIFSHLYKNNALPFILGTTGESASLSPAFKLEYMQASVKNKKAGTTLYVSVSSNSVEETIDFSRRCFDAGVDVVAATLPTFYQLSESMMKRYFEQLANQIKGPLIIYNIPATTHMSIPLHILEELSQHENIVGTKDSERNEERLDKSLELWSAREDFSHFLGWAAKSAYSLINGSDGLIPSTGNLHPGLYRDMTQAVSAGDHVKAYRLQHQSDLLGNLYQNGHTLGESLAALKVLMCEYGLCTPDMLQPLMAMPQHEQTELLQSFQKLIKQEEIQLNIPLTHV